MRLRACVPLFGSSLGPRRVKATKRSTRRAHDLAKKEISPCRRA